MNTLCEICNNKKEECFICKGKSASGCVEHSSTMTIYDNKHICKTCLELHKCIVNIAEKDIIIVSYPRRKNKCELIASYILNLRCNRVPSEEIKPIVIECNNIKKWCPMCRKKETINCSIHNPNIKNTCDKCVKLLQCQKCNETKETTWAHKCGRFCTDCVKKSEIDISPKTMYDLFENISTEYTMFTKWVTYCKDCIDGSVLDVQRREYSKLVIN